ncbi:hypothetical protein EI94DRAFT_1918920 [Lactarius quietus]|nr:hypothetical protein EI94DRAFT_1918920 [Lactarius quietus]
MYARWSPPPEDNLDRDDATLTLALQAHKMLRCTLERKKDFGERTIVKQLSGVGEGKAIELLGFTGAQSNKIVYCGNAQCMDEFKTVTGPLTVSIVHYRESVIESLPRLTTHRDTQCQFVASELEFWDIDFNSDDVVKKDPPKEEWGTGIQQLGTADHVEWDPSGRYLATAASAWTHTIENGYAIWDFRGQEIEKRLLDRFKQFLMASTSALRRS